MITISVLKLLGNTYNVVLLSKDKCKSKGKV